MSAVSDLAGTVNNARQAVGGAVSYIGTAKDTAAGLITSGGLDSNNSSSSGANTNSDGTIKQTERGLTIRPRSTPLTNKTKYTSERGPIASIKLKSDRTNTQVLNDLMANGNSNQGLSEVANSLLSDGGYTDFLLTNIDVSFNEKVQVNEVFGDSEVVYYFGRSPVTFNLSGIIFDDIDNNWFYKYIVAYQGVLRGSRVAQNHQLVQINLPNMTIIGTIMGTAYSQDSSRDTDIHFTMQFLAKSIQPRPVVMPSELLNNDALKLNIAQAELPARFQNTASINSIKKSVDSARAYLGSTMGASSGILGDIASSIADFAGGTNTVVSNAINSARGFFDNSVGGFLSVASLRANVIAPIYGVLTTLTKVVKSITGSVLSLFSSGSSLLGSILQDVKSIANEAIALVNAVESGVNSFVSGIEAGQNDLRRTIRALKNAAGAITSAPENISSILKRLSKSGLKSGHVASLKSGRVSRSKIALLNSGSVHSASSGATISG